MSGEGKDELSRYLACVRVGAGLGETLAVQPPGQVLRLRERDEVTVALVTVDLREKKLSKSLGGCHWIPQP